MEIKFSAFGKNNLWAIDLPMLTQVKKQKFILLT